MRLSNPINIDHQLIELPPTIKDHYGNVQLVVDALHISDVPFPVSISNHTHCGTSNAVYVIKSDSLGKGIKNVIR